MTEGGGWSPPDGRLIIGPIKTGSTGKDGGP